MRLGKTKKPEPPPDRVIKEGEQPKKLEPQLKPKKPRKWDGWLSVAFISICILMTLIFSGTEFNTNAIFAAALIPVGLCHYTYYLVFAKKRRRKKYNKDMSEYDYNTRMDSRTRYRKTAAAERQREVDIDVGRVIEENLRRGTKAWDVRDMEDLFPSPEEQEWVER
jgi:amino acid permease